MPGKPAGKRVVKSALEMILDEPSPSRTTIPFIGKTRSAPRSNSFTVSYAAAPPSVHENPKEGEAPTKIETALPLSVVSPPDNQFPCLETPSRPLGSVSPSRSSGAQRSLFATPPPGSLSGPSKTDEEGKSHWGHSLRQKCAGASISAEDVERAVKEAVKEYEVKRDSEEAAALEEIRAEIEIQNSRYESLLALNHTIAKENDQLRLQLTQAVEENSNLHQSLTMIAEQHGKQSDSLNYLEKELTRTREQLEKQASSDDVQALEEAWQQEVASYRSRITSLQAERETLERKVQEEEVVCRKLEQLLEEKTEELAQKQQAAEEMESETTDIKEKVATLSSCMTSVEGMLKERDDTIAKLQGQLREKQKSSLLGQKEAKETSEAQKEAWLAQLNTVQRSLDHQTSEVRRKTYRCVVLEKEKNFLQVEMEKWRKVPLAVKGQQSTLLHSLDVLSKECCTHWKKLLAATTALENLEKNPTQLRELFQESAVQAEGSDEAEVSEGLREVTGSSCDSPQEAITTIAFRNAEVIRKAQLLGRRSRALFACCTEKTATLATQMHVSVEEHLQEKQLLEDACRYLKGRRASDAEKLKELKVEVSRLTSELEHVEREQMGKERLISEIQREAAATEEQKLEVVASLSRANAMVLQLNSELSDRGSRLKQAEEEKTALQTMLDASETNLTQLKEEYDKNIARPRAKISELCGKLKELEEQLTHSQEQYRAANTKAKETAAQLAQLKSQYALKRQSLEKEIQASHAETATLRENVVSLKSRLRKEEDEHKAEGLKRREELHMALQTLRDIKEKDSLREHQLTERNHLLEVQKSEEKTHLLSLFSLLHASDDPAKEMTIQENSAYRSQIDVLGDETLEVMRQRVLAAAQRVIIDFTSLKAEKQARQRVASASGSNSGAVSYSPSKRSPSLKAVTPSDAMAPRVVGGSTLFPSALDVDVGSVLAAASSDLLTEDIGLTQPSDVHRGVGASPSPVAPAGARASPTRFRRRSASDTTSFPFDIYPDAESTTLSRTPGPRLALQSATSGATLSQLSVTSQRMPFHALSVNTSGGAKKINNERGGPLVASDGEVNGNGLAARPPSLR